MNVTFSMQRLALWSMAERQVEWCSENEAPESSIRSKGVMRNADW
jgi:hypothetical protein